MNLDEIQTLWHSNLNSPSAEQRTALIASFTMTLRRRRRQELAWLAWTFFVLTILTVFAGWVLFGTDKVQLTAEWATIPLLLLPWVFAVLFLRRFLRQSSPRPGGDGTISDALRAAFAANQSERSKLKAIGVMYVIALPILAVSIWQLESVGKVSARELISIVAFLGGALALSAATILVKYWLSLVPKGRNLRTLLAQLDQAPE